MHPELASPQPACAPESPLQSLSSIVEVRSAGGDMAGMARPGVKPGGGEADPAVAAILAQVAQVAASSSPRRRCTTATYLCRVGLGLALTLPLGLGSGLGLGLG